MKDVDVLISEWCECKIRYGSCKVTCNTTILVVVVDIPFSLMRY